MKLKKKLKKKWKKIIEIMYKFFYYSEIFNDKFLNNSIRLSFIEKKVKSWPKRSYDKSFVDPKIAILMVGILGSGKTRTKENVVNIIL